MAELLAVTKSPQSSTWRTKEDRLWDGKIPIPLAVQNRSPWQELTTGGGGKQSRDLHFPHLSIKSYHSPMFHNHCATTKMEGGKKITTSNKKK